MYHLDELRRRKSALYISEWIEELQGREASELWVWECTPIPCGLPSDQQLEEGLAVALGEISIGCLVNRSHEEMTAALAEYEHLNITDEE